MTSIFVKDFISTSFTLQVDMRSKSEVCNLRAEQSNQMTVGSEKVRKSVKVRRLTKHMGKFVRLAASDYNSTSTPWQDLVEGMCCLVIRIQALPERSDPKVDC